MSLSGRALGIRKHRVVPAALANSSVVRWRCLDCDREFGCASEVLEESCAADAE